MDIQYIGERLFPGQLGNAFIILAFVSALLSAVAFLIASKDTLEVQSWRTIGRLSYRIHSIAVVGIVCTLFYMLYNHMFEYEYVWHHSNKEMRMRYILSCFWEGQEGRREYNAFS